MIRELNYLKRQRKIMDGNKASPEKILDELFLFAKEIMEKKKIYPYVSFIVKEGVIVSKGYNQEREKRDITFQCQVTAIRQAQEALDTGNLEGYTLISLFEPTILGFDVALWSGIRDFVWCINSSSAPKQYNNMKYSVLDYQKNHPDKITVQNGLREKEPLKLVNEAQRKKYYPDNISA